MDRADGDWWNDLGRFERRVFSQNGEDGVLERVFDRLGSTDRFCVECGVQDGRECNTRYLRETLGSTGLQLDADPGGNPEVRRVWLTAENVNDVFRQHQVPRAFDLLSLDIDGNDYWVWEALDCAPRVVVVEYNASVPAGEGRVVRYDPHFRWDGTDYFGAGLRALEHLGRRKGYTLVHCEAAGVNAFFVQTSLVPSGRGRPVEEVYRPPAYGPDGRGHPHSPGREWVWVVPD